MDILCFGARGPHAFRRLGVRGHGAVIAVKMVDDLRDILSPKKRSARRHPIHAMPSASGMSPRIETARGASSGRVRHSTMCNVAQPAAMPDAHGSAWFSHTATFARPAMVRETLLKARKLLPLRP